jgi:succinate dehydrogenase / fumarate reductase membrane anchor subunit
VTRHTHGLRAWLLQRASAVYLALFILYLIGYFVLNPPSSYAAWRDWVTNPVVSVAWTGFVLAVMIHGWVGMRDIILDYVGNIAVRLVVLALVGVVLAGSGVWAVRSLLLAAA